MKIQELTVGNWYNSVKFNKPVMCELSDLSELYRRCEGAECDESIIAEMFEPLALTEEWLVKFGFVEDNEEWGSGTLCFEKWDGKLHYSAGEGVKMSKPIEYVHQFQNIVAALTGIELKIKQP